jgi:polysaccharide deacetylase family protein (PEP-CTERM system associated)
MYPAIASSKSAVAPLVAAPVLNAMTIDVEDYFHVSAFASSVSPSAWPSLESRVVRNTERLIEIFDECDVTATFFVLGWVAERYPNLVRQIAAGGHEIASHGYWHQLVYDQTPAQFREDVRRARGAIEAAASVPVTGYRAPSFSITKSSLWALDVLIEEGYAYDSSIYPIRHDRYGIPDWPREFRQVRRPAGMIWELPGTTVRLGSMNMPIGGGGYFRWLPYGWTRQGIARLNDVEGRAAMFYLHPWEIDPDQPRLSGTFLSRLRHYHNLVATTDRLRRLLREFPFGSVSAVLAQAPLLANAGSFRD